MGIDFTVLGERNISAGHNKGEENVYNFYKGPVNGDCVVSQQGVCDANDAFSFAGQNDRCRYDEYSCDQSYKASM